MIVFMGTPEFAVPILEMLIKEKYQIGLVVTQPDKRIGRKKTLEEPPVKVVAKKYNLEVFQPFNIKDDYQKILDLKPKLIITAAYGQIIPKVIFDNIKSINIHGSLLPKYRGGAPIQYALFNGDLKTGITIMEMIYKMDAGNIIYQEEISIDKDDDYLSLSNKLSLLGKKMLKEKLPTILNNHHPSIIQKEDLVTYSPTLKYEDEALDFKKEASYNHNRIRGLSPNVGAHFKINGTIVKVFKSKINDIIKLSPNEIKIIDKKLLIGCKDYALEILLIQQQSKRLMSIKDYLNGQTLFKDGGFINE
ncbi:MAG: methionyl-tRNA formyltransferase [Acholeplasmataceae bacterium]